MSIWYVNEILKETILFGDSKMKLFFFTKMRIVEICFRWDNSVPKHFIKIKFLCVYLSTLYMLYLFYFFHTMCAYFVSLSFFFSFLYLFYLLQTLLKVKLDSTFVLKSDWCKTLRKLEKLNTIQPFLLCF
jgi:hypothetical protein